MHHDATQIASELIQKHGVDQAIEIATTEIIASHRSGDFYALSVWREVRRLLRDRKQAAT